MENIRFRVLPAVYADETESQTLEIVMEDAVTGVEVTLQYGVLPDYDVITRSEKIVYRGEGKICIRKAQSACLDFVQGKYDLLTFTEDMQWRERCRESRSHMEVM